MMQQYQALKADHPDALLMFRLGDFYELFFDDAVVASQVLNITLTGRDAGQLGRVPMCGVPFHSLESHLQKLVEAGHRVAICEQLEDPRQAKGLVQRKVVRVVTPGTMVHDDSAANRFLAAAVERNGEWGLAAVDVGTGEVWCGQTERGDDAYEWLAAWKPAEILVYERALAWPWLDRWLAQDPVRVTRRPEPRRPEAEAAQVLCSQYGVPNLAPLDLEERAAAAEAAAMAIQYARETQRSHLPHLRWPRDARQAGCLVLDQTARRNLELLETSRARQRQGSLFHLLNRTRTPMGQRLLRRWMERPLCDRAAIEQRLDAVEAFVSDLFLRAQTDALLRQVYDLDRLAGKLALGTANARDLLALARSIQVLPRLSELMSDRGGLLESLIRRLPDLASLAERVTSTLVDDPPVSVREGGLIRPGVDKELDELRALSTDGRRWLAELEQRERERTGIKSLKVGFNKVFGYYIEVSNANRHLVPPEYERRQTLAGAERYVLPELKEQEARILHAEEMAMEREYASFVALRDEVLARLADVQSASEVLAVIDVLLSLAAVSADRGYVRPVLREERGVHIVKGRHPTVEAEAAQPFVPNDVRLGENRHLLLITGPNMAGKSTYMRQTALIVLMAHMGCFVPAEAAEIGLVDRIFTRIGASDDLAAGQSTFMVEMVELAQILRYATDRSLVLLDEIGRGTSTYDGLCIAEAVMEYLTAPGRRPLTLFATHYHELTEAAARLPGAVNASVRVEETADGITFLHTVVERPADRSYGIQVARLAGVPDEVIRRADELLAAREAAAAAESPGMGDAAGGAGFRTVAAGDMAAHTGLPGASSDRRGHASADRLHDSDGQPLPLLSLTAGDLARRLASIDVVRTTPLEALQLLDDLVRQAKEVMAWDASGSCPRRWPTR